MNNSPPLPTIRLASNAHGLAARALADILPRSEAGRLGRRAGEPGWWLEHRNGDDPLLLSLGDAPGGGGRLVCGLDVWWAADGTGILYRRNGGRARVLGLPIALDGPGPTLEMSSVEGALDCGPGPLDDEDDIAGWAEAWFGSDGQVLARRLISGQTGDPDRWDDALEAARALIRAAGLLRLRDLLLPPEGMQQINSGVRLDPVRSSFVLHPEQTVWTEAGPSVSDTTISLDRLATTVDADRSDGLLRAAGWTREDAVRRLGSVLGIALRTSGVTLSTPHAAWKDGSGICGRVGRAFTGRTIPDTAADTPVGATGEDGEASDPAPDASGATYSRLSVLLARAARHAADTSPPSL